MPLTWCREVCRNCFGLCFCSEQDGYTGESVAMADLVNRSVMAGVLTEATGP